MSDCFTKATYGCTLVSFPDSPCMPWIIRTNVSRYLISMMHAPTWKNRRERKRKAEGLVNQPGVAQEF